MEKIWTIGHSTRTSEEFTGLHAAHSIRRLAQFNKEALASSLAGHGIDYLHFLELGGRRKPRPDSHNTAWRNASFRGYADYMETPEFRDGIKRLMEFATENTAIMCAEAVWWRCHRALISDYLKVHGIEVLHIIDQKKVEPHPFTSPARIVNGELNYG